jgi:drug/metabolite transporter (DMT)-like permease
MHILAASMHPFGRLGVYCRMKASRYDDRLATGGVNMNIYLALAVGLFAAGNSIVKWLIREGGKFGLTTPGAISFCNLLFVGNICGSIQALLLGGAREILRELHATSWQVRRQLLFEIVLGVTIAALLFTALSRTMVTNLILLSRIEPVAFALFSAWLFKSKVTQRQWLGFAFIIGGSLCLILVQSMYRLMTGDLLVMLAALLQGYSVCVSKQNLSLVGRNTLVVARTFGSAMIFFTVAVSLFGFHHFAAAFGPGLWLVMSIYALISVVLAQFSWYKALDTVPDVTVARGLMVQPILAIGFAFLLLGELPTTTHVVAGAVIFTGMLLSHEPPKERPLAIGGPEHRLEAA